jgi:hypothetical protein
VEYLPSMCEDHQYCQKKKKKKIFRIFTVCLLRPLNIYSLFTWLEPLHSFSGGCDFVICRLYYFHLFFYFLRDITVQWMKAGTLTSDCLGLNPYSW